MPTKIPSHRPLRTGPRSREARPHAAARGYCSAAHKAWRQAVLNRYHWQCVDCGRVAYGRDMHADHVQPVSVAPERRYDVTNGAARCVSCHARKTNDERRAGEGGSNHGRAV
jgi:5-methylcytosine-specific restriction endonuclease McrA